jgi:hypothetical protein
VQYLQKFLELPKPRVKPSNKLSGYKCKNASVACFLYKAVYKNTLMVYYVFTNYKHIAIIRINTSRILMFTFPFGFGGSVVL